MKSNILGPQAHGTAPIVILPLLTNGTLHAIAIAVAIGKLTSGKEFVGVVPSNAENMVDWDTLAGRNYGVDRVDPEDRLLFGGIKYYAQSFTTNLDDMSLEKISGTSHHRHSFGKQSYHKYFCTTSNHTILVSLRPTHLPNWTKTFPSLHDRSSQVTYTI
jgi:hypothetical protein